MPQPLSTTRQFLMWWFNPPGVPWVSATLAIDFTAARAYLAALAEQEGPRVSVQHLLSGAVGRTLAAFPDANARIIGNRIVHQDSVGVVAPVNLLGHAAGSKRELSFAVTSDVHRRSLRDIAADTRKAVKDERAGRISNPFARMVIRLMEKASPSATWRGLELLDRAMKRRPFADQVYKLAPFTTGLTNPGAAIGDREGLLFRGGAVSLPTKLVHVGTLWGITPVQDEVIPINGVPAVRPMLPVMLVFDHRLIDGVRASKLSLHFFDILQDPAATFGERGELEGPPVKARR